MRSSTRTCTQAARLALASCLMAPLVVAAAAEVSGPSSAARGASVTWAFSDHGVAFEAADFVVSWDSSVLTLLGLQTGSLTPGAFIAHDPLAAGVMQVSLAAAMPVSGTAPGSLFEATFLVGAAAPFGSTSIGFAPTPGSAYTFAAFAAPLDVVTQMPEPGTALMMLLALAGLGGRAVVLRRRGAGRSAATPAGAAAAGE